MKQSENNRMTGVSRHLTIIPGMQTVLNFRLKDVDRLNGLKKNDCMLLKEIYFTYKDTYRLNVKELKNYSTKMEIKSIQE